MADVAKLVNYYKDCFVADNRDTVIYNFYGSKIGLHATMEGREELTSGFLPYAHINEELAREIQKVLQVYGQEKELVYGSLFLIWRREGTQRGDQKICSPLFLYPATIVESDGIFYIQIDISQRRINYAVLNSLKMTENLEDSNLYELMYRELPRDIIDEKNIAEISIALRKYLPEIDCSPLVEYPELHTEKKIKRMLQPRQLDEMKQPVVIPASAYGLLDKSSDTMGIINELTTIGQATAFSPPMAAVFGAQLAPQLPLAQGRVPSVLSVAQRRILEAASTYPFTLVVGPPGTGKSYTIASLAVEYLSKGKSVLIASRTNQAVDVVADKIENQLGIRNVVVRGGRSTYLRDLRNHLKQLLSGITNYNQETNKKLKQLHSALNTIDKKLLTLEQEFDKRTEQELHWGKYLWENDGNSGIISGIRKKYIGWRTAMSTPHWQLIAEIETLLAEQSTKVIQYIETGYLIQENEALKRHRDQLNSFLKAISARTSSKQDEYFGHIDFSFLLKTFPVWLVKMSDIYKILPLQEQLFDLAIIDEATQCDIASCIPILQRAKRVVFAGDPNQLRHVSFLSMARQQTLRAKHELDQHDRTFTADLLNYREKSILDVVGDRAASSEQVIFLDEHFRSTPQIISFSNRNFYSNSLRVMTQKPNIPSGEGIFLTPCNGTRNAKGQNIEECEHILQTISEVVRLQEKLEKGICQSIGILSPFRNQTDYISARINETLSFEALQKHNISVGTAYSFQGEERDIMFLSFSLDNSSHPSAFYHLNKSDVFNVSITRARSVLHLLYSVDIERLKPDTLFRQYLESFRGAAATSTHSNASHDRFAAEVSDFIRSIGLQVWTAFPVAGLNIDLVVQSAGRSFGIDLIGCPGEFEDAFSLERYKMLRRAGIGIFPLPYTFWVAEREKCIAEVCHWLGVSSQH